MSRLLIYLFSQRLDFLVKCKIKSKSPRKWNTRDSHPQSQMRHKSLQKKPKREFRFLVKFVGDQMNLT